MTHKAVTTGVHWYLTVEYQGEKLLAPDIVDSSTGHRSPAYWLPCACCGNLNPVRFGVVSYICEECQRPCEFHDCGLLIHEHFDIDGNRFPCESLPETEHRLLPAEIK